MPPSRRKKLFEELGLLNEEQEANPYETLGIRPAFARELLQNDPAGATVQIAVAGMYRALSRIYHPDIPKSGDDARFQGIVGANKKIEKASPAALLRWAKADSTPASPASSRLVEQREAVAQRATELVQTNMELGHDPTHFSQLRWSQGVLLHNRDTTILLREHETDGITAARGQLSILDEHQNPYDTSTQAFDFQEFLRRHQLFGLEPGMRIGAYLDEKGRASILGADLSFIMDVTGPVASYRQQRAKQDQSANPKDATDSAAAWARVAEPVLLTTEVPLPRGIRAPQAQIVTFPEQLQTSGKKTANAMQLPLTVAGSLTDAEFFRKVRHSRHLGAAALTGAATSRAVNHFGVVALPARQLIEQDAGYSPLITPGNALLLFDPANRQPVVTDAQVVGMIGNGPQV